MGEVGQKIPEYIPQGLKDEGSMFISFLPKYGKDKLLGFIRKREKELQGNFDPITGQDADPSIPAEIRTHIGPILDIQLLINLGPDGLHEYLGEETETALKPSIISSEQSIRGQKKRGAVGQVKHAFEHICRCIGSTSYKDVMESLSDDFWGMNDSDLILELYESLEDPIRIHKFSIDSDSIDTATRLALQDRKGIEQNRSIGTIKNILSKIDL